MCFTITTPEKIAKKDIVCYKTFRKTSPKTKNDYIAVYYNSFYKLGRIYTTKKFGVGTDGWGDNIIYEGRHSYSNLKYIKKKLLWFEEVLAKCIIPKGTKYYYNAGDKEYVSLAIKLVKEIK